MTKQLSPAAQAVTWAYDNTPEKETGNHRYHWLAAALRAAVDQIRYTDQLGLTGFGGYIQAQDQILAIADELENND